MGDECFARASASFMRCAVIAQRRYAAPGNLVNATAIIVTPMAAQQPITAVLLAAGAGTRFGGGKLLHPLEDGVAIAAHAARNLVNAGLDVTAVVRAGDFPLADMLEQEGCYVT